MKITGSYPLILRTPAAPITTPVWSAPIPLVGLEDRVPVFARVRGMWGTLATKADGTAGAAVTGGAAGSAITVALFLAPTDRLSGGAPITAEQILLFGKVGSNTAANITIDMTGGANPADGAHTSTWFNIITNSGTSPQLVLPLMGFLFARLSNASTAYAAGDISLDVQLLAEGA